LPITIETLENFVDEIKRTIPLSSVWIKKGKFNLSNHFQTLATQQSSGIPYVNKAHFVEHVIPFTVIAVSNPVTTSFPQSATRMKTVESIRLTIEVENLGEYLKDDKVAPTMLLSFETGYDGRDALMQALKDDIRETGPVEHVIVRGSDKFYSLGVLE
jgi:hypothetical protein